jgi:hypothetical protein
MEDKMNESENASRVRDGAFEITCHTAIMYLYVLMLPRRAIVAPLQLRATHPSSVPSRPRLHPYRQFHASLPDSFRTMSEFYKLKAQLPGSKEYDFDQLKGNVVLIVNVASNW